MEISEEIKQTYIAMLYKVSIADGKIHEFEDSYIRRIAERLSVNNEDLANIMEKPNTHITKLPETYPQRIEFFYNLLFMMGIDNEITKSEKELCKEIGFKLCFNPMLMEDLINIMIEHLGKNIPSNEVVNAVLKYQN